METSFAARSRTIFEAAVDLPAPARAAQIEAACDGDAVLRRTVERLLAADAAAGAFLRPGPAWASGEAEESRVGVYTLVRKLGEGGMGHVYLAEPGPVAIKLIRRDLDPEIIRRRFRRERETLSRLDHPGIARLLDGGTTSHGTPYLVLAYIDGVPLDEFCDAGRLTLGARIAVFLNVCRAVSFAHQRFVIHRDLKPANVLVTADAQPVVLDFGLATLVRTGVEQSLSSTKFGHRLLTPEYASPEQVTGARVTPAADVYALGLLLYELLAGVRAQRFSTWSLSEIVEVVCTRPVPPPSMATAFEWRDELRGTLDRIVMKAIAKPLAGRYAHVEEVTDDLWRYTQGAAIPGLSETP